VSSDGRSNEPRRVAKAVVQIGSLARSVLAAARRRLRRTFLLVVALTLAYTQCLSSPPWDSPDPIPAPTSLARSVTVDPGVWAMPRGDAGSTGVTMAQPPLDAPVAWVRDLPQSPIVFIADHDSVYLAIGETSELLALATATGKERWTVETPGRPDHAPALAGDALYVQVRGRGLMTLDARTGRERWVDRSGALTTTPTVAAGMLWGGQRGQVVVLDAETGAKLAQVGIDGQFVKQPIAIGPDRVVVAKPDTLLFLDRTTGERTFEARFPDLQFIVAEGDIVVALSDRQIVGFDSLAGLPWWDGTRDWWFRLRVYVGLPGVPSPPNRWVQQVHCEALAPVLHHDLVILACEEGNVRAFALSTGEQLWTQQLERLVAGPVLTASGLLLATEQGLALLDPGTGEEFGRRELSEWPIHDMIVTSDAIYLLTIRHQLVALRGAD
jgi:outer membrane protein assembly factor BamB